MTTANHCLRYMPAPTPGDERERMLALDALDLLDTPAEERFDRYTRLLTTVLSVPVALVSIVDDDRQWFKSRQGLDATETPRSVSFCGHAIMKAEPLVIEDTMADPRFAENPLVVGPPGVRFYAGAPIEVEGGARVGTLCAIDTVPRRLATSDVDFLRDIASMVATEMIHRAHDGIDALTGLPRRHRFLALLIHADELAMRRQETTARLRVRLTFAEPPSRDDLNRFLRAWGARLRSYLSTCWAVGRPGRDTFAAVLLGADAELVDKTARRLEDDARSLGIRLCPAAGVRAEAEVLETAVGEGRFDSLFTTMPSQHSCPLEALSASSTAP